MQFGKCKLCLEEKNLCDSHLAPSGLYRYCRAQEFGPIRMTNKSIDVAETEVSDYLLCLDCENLLNREGENWLLPKLATMDKKFPFFDLVTAVEPDAHYDKTRVYSCSRNPEIGFRKLTNFAIGVFWKASAHSWRNASGEPLIDLGRYQEEFRFFLRKQGPFPVNSTLMIGVLHPDDPVIGFNLPRRRANPLFHQYLFYVPGIIFLLAVGRQLPKEIKEMCFFSNETHPIFVGDYSGAILELMARDTRKAVESIEIRNFHEKGHS